MTTVLKISGFLRGTAIGGVQPKFFHFEVKEFQEKQAKAKAKEEARAVGRKIKNLRSIRSRRT